MQFKNKLVCFIVTTEQRNIKIYHSVGGVLNTSVANRDAVEQGCPHFLLLASYFQNDHEPQLIMTDRHQGDWTNYHFLLLYQPVSVTLPTRPQLFHSQKQGPVAILDSCFFGGGIFFLPSWATDGVWAPVQLHWLHNRYTGWLLIYIFCEIIVNNCSKDYTFIVFTKSVFF